MVSSRSDANLWTSDGISLLPNSLIIFPSFHNLPQLMYINNIIMAWDSPHCIHDLVSIISGYYYLPIIIKILLLAISRLLFAIAPKLSFHTFTIFLSPEVPLTVRGRD